MSRLVLFLCVTVLAFLAPTSSAHICDVCDCQPNKFKIFSITCDCGSVRDLHLTSSVMMGIDSTNMVFIKNCQIVSIERNSFSQLKRLDTLAIQNSLRLYLAAGAFSNLNSLLINNVQEISFGEMALMGARDIKNININFSNITVLPTYSFYDIHGMEDLTLNGVTIDKINSYAFNVHTKSLSIENSRINFIDKEAFVVQAEKVLVNKSEIAFQMTNSTKITTTYQTRLLESDLKGNFNPRITSPFLELSGNYFDNLTNTPFENVQMARLMDNLILNMDYESLQRFNHKDFHDNQFVCKCHMDLLNITSNSMSYEILKNNFCVTNCSLNLFEFEVESAASCMKDNDVDVTSFCSYDRLLKNVSYNFSTNPIDNFTEGHVQTRFLIKDGGNHSGSGNLMGELAVLSFVLALTQSALNM